MSRTIEIRDVPDDIAMRLEAQAKGEGFSDASELVRDLLMRGLEPYAPVGTLGDLIREIFGTEPLGMTEEEIEAEVHRACAEIRAERGGTRA